jgi:NAD(P)-dependent dehydrogenase (short-subunit alcohol dehydrogenase family)
MNAGRFDIGGNIVVVTGGAGQLGQNFAAALSEAGARVAVFDRAAGRLAEGDNLRYFPCDVTDRATLTAALADVERHWGVPAGLVNAAAIDAPPDAPAEENGPFETYPDSSWDRVMAVNVKGVFLSCQIVGGAMARQKRGSIVNVASIYGMVSPDQGLYQYRRDRGDMFYKPIAYSVSKSALYNMTRYLATYWGAAAVRVNTVTFGGVANNQDAEFLKRYHAKVPLGRMANADEYNGAIQFLLSEASSYMTGANLVLDGGLTAW